MQGSSCGGLSLAAGQGGSSGTPQPLCSSSLSVTDLPGQGGCEQRGRTSSPQPAQSSGNRAASGFIPGGPAFSEKKPKAPTQQSCRPRSPRRSPQPTEGFRFCFLSRGRTWKRQEIAFFFFPPDAQRTKPPLEKEGGPGEAETGTPKGANEARKASSLQRAGLSRRSLLFRSS